MSEHFEPLPESVIYDKRISGLINPTLEGVIKRVGEAFEIMPEDIAACFPRECSLLLATHLRNGILLSFARAQIDPGFVLLNPNRVTEDIIHQHEPQILVDSDRLTITFARESQSGEPLHPLVRSIDLPLHPESATPHEEDGVKLVLSAPRFRVEWR